MRGLIAHRMTQNATLRSSMYSVGYPNATKGEIVTASSSFQWPGCAIAIVSISAGLAYVRIVNPHYP